MSERPIHVRAATPADAAAIARVHVESSEDAYAPLAGQWTADDVETRAQQWSSRLAGPSDDPWFALVAERDGEVVGFVAAGPARRGDVEAEVEVYVIHVLLRHRGVGIGARLWAAACERVRGPELRSMYVATFAELRCCSFYEARGGEVAERVPGDFKGGRVTKVVYLWRRGRTSLP